MSDNEKHKIFHPKGACSAICSIDPTKCPYYQAVDPLDRRSIPSEDDEDYEDDEDRKEEMDLEEPYERGDDDLYSPVIPYMDTAPAYLDRFKGQTTSVGDCNGLFIFPYNMNLYLCKSFNQYCINFGNRTRLITIIGEIHYPLHDSNTFEKNANAYRSIFIDQYIKEINVNSNAVGKRLAVFLEESPIFDIEYQSYNIWRIKQLNNYITNVADKSIEPLLNIGNVDIRYIGYESFSENVLPQTFKDFLDKSKAINEGSMFIYKIAQLYQNYGNLDDFLKITNLEELRKLSIYLDKLINYCHRLFTQDGRFKISQMYLQEHLEILNSFYTYIKSQSDYIKELLNELISVDKLTVLSKMPHHYKEKALEIVENFVIFASVTDLYSMIHFFRKDYPYDDIIYLVGNHHAKVIGGYLNKYRVKKIDADKNSVMNVKGTYF